MTFQSPNEESFLSVSRNTPVRTYLWRIAVNVVAASRLVPQRVRFLMYRAAGIATDSWDVRAGCRIKFPLLTIGEGTFINDNCAFENFAPIVIGRDCAIGPEVMFCTTTHVLGRQTRRAGQVIGKAVRVGDGCWIGARALILPGVSIGDGCVIAAGAVIGKDCDPNGIYAGVPARRIKEATE